MQDGELLVSGLPCVFEDCGSSDAMAVYTHNIYCFSCEQSKKLDGQKFLDELDADVVLKAKKKNKRTMEHNEELRRGILWRIKDRAIDQETCAKYGVTILTKDKKPVAHVYPYYDADDKHIANKIRHLPKQFECEGDINKAGLFGQHLFPKGCAKYITICGGELDALSAYQMQGSRYPCVSVRNGEATAFKDVKRELEYLESFEAVYICLDADEVGNKAALRVAQVLSPGKARIVRLDKTLKDPSGYLVAGKAEEFIAQWWKAELYTPAGILPSSELKHRIRERKLTSGLPYPWDGLNKLTYGIRPGEAVIVTAETGVGKTQFLREIEHHILKTDPKARIGAMFLEETPEDSGLGLMSVEGSVPFHLPDAIYTENEYAQAERILDGDRVFFYDSFGSTKIDDIIARVRYYVKGLDCKYVIIDHLSIIVSDHTQGDERKLLDQIMTKLKTLTIELDMALIAVVHLNRQGTIRGTAAIEQLANIVFKLHRDKLSPDKELRNTTFVTIEKNRFSGKTGPATALLYDDVTGRLNEKTIEEAQLEAIREIDRHNLEEERVA